MSRRKSDPFAGFLLPTPHGGARATDPLSSHVAAASVSMRSGSMRAKLLRTYTREPQIDEAAMLAAGVNPRSCWWKRCSELREMGLIEPVVMDDGSELMQVSSMGEQCRACRITAAGAQWCRDNPLYDPYTGTDYTEGAEHA